MSADKGCRADRGDEKGETILMRAVIALSVLVAAASRAAIAKAGSERTSGPIAGNGRWIAFATAAASDVYGGSIGSPLTAKPGSDLFVTHPGGRTRLVAGRGTDGDFWNVCPAFSPNGRMLAFARVDLVAFPLRSTITVVHIGPRGPLRAGKIVLSVPGDATRCPRWSADSSRVGYLYRGKVVVRGLDGSRQHLAKGDPTIRDFNVRRAEIVSPTGELTAKRGADGIVVSRADGTTWSVIPYDLGGYEIAGWSPDGRKLLVTTVGAIDYQLRAISVDPPFVSQKVVSHIRMLGTRSSPPGCGDVSWQPVPLAPARVLVGTSGLRSALP
jgi:Tol biopolymer transport system component